MCKQCNTKPSLSLDTMSLDNSIKERRRLSNELSSIKSRLIELRIDMGLLCDEAQVVTSFKVELMNELSRAYDKLDNANTSFTKIINDAVL
jgi:hypothetical protein